VIGDTTGSRSLGFPVEAVLWQAGQPIRLQSGSRWASSAGNGLNNNGLAVGGASAYEAGTRIQHAILWKGLETAGTRHQQIQMFS
jgi:hypothetical protein